MNTRSITGEELYNIVLHEIFAREKQHLLAKNLIGICTDRGANMLSSKSKGLANRLLKDYPQIITAHDYSHAFHLVAKYASKKLSADARQLVKRVCKHFKKSALRRSKFRRIQEELGDKDTGILDILGYVKTRWTSLQKAAERVKTLWTALENSSIQKRIL